MTGIEAMSGVRVRFSALHHEPYGDAPHAHLWTVWAYFAAEPPVDGRVRRDRLATICRLLQPNMNDTLGREATNEGVARWALRRLKAEGCKATHVIREEEGLSAWAWVRGALG